MKLNENYENKNNIFSLNGQNQKEIENSFSNLLKLKRKRYQEKDIYDYKIDKFDENKYSNKTIMTEEFEFLNISETSISSSINQNELEYKHNSNNYNIEDKILQLKIDLTDKPYCQFKNFD